MTLVSQCAVWKRLGGIVRNKMGSYPTVWDYPVEMDSCQFGVHDDYS